MNPLQFLNNLPSISRNKCNELTISAFERGYVLGREEAIYSLRDRQQYDCIFLNDFEKAIVMNFLEEYNLEFGYNLEENGFYIVRRRRNERK